MRNQPIHWLDDDDRREFPPVEAALRQPNGLLAVGGRLSPARLEQAYRLGIFPWFEEGQPVLWWSPDPRALLYPEALHVSRSLRKRLRRGGFQVTMDQDFRSVVSACAEPRPGQQGTWITRSMQTSYARLRQLGLAHSVEVWAEERLVGGLYGVALGRGFFGESMFSRRSDASKVALVWLVRQLERWGFAFLDCQIGSSHLYSLGAVDVPRERFQRELREAVDRRGPGLVDWSFDAGFHPLDAGK